MSRTLVIGDIHGGLRGLKQVLNRANVSVKDTLIFLGDFVDGWSESAQVIDFVMALGAQQHCVYIKGNHDVWCEDWLRTDIADTTWLLHGGKETVDSYKEYSLTDKKHHLAFLQQMPFYYRDEQDRLFIHAGFTSMHGAEHEFHSSNFSWDRTLWEMAITMDKSIQKKSKLYPKRLLLYKEIYIGHTPTLYYDVSVPMNGCNVWNIDTGAGFTGKLSIMDVDTKQFWQSDPLAVLYPDEKGRNKR